MPKPIVSVGYQGRSLDGLCVLMKRMGVEILIDVRERAWSHRPEFRKTRIASALSSHGIEYEHWKDAGNQFRSQGKGRSHFRECARKYARYLDANPEIAQRVLTLCRKRRIALFCYEGDQDSCHRSVLVERIAQLVPGLSIIEAK